MVCARGDEIIQLEGGMRSIHTEQGATEVGPGGSYGRTYTGRGRPVKTTDGRWYGRPEGSR